MKRIGVVIPTWNGRHLLPFCLQALAGQTDVQLDVVVVDNGSRDDSREWLAREHPWVRVLPLPANAGFAGAVNAGIAACDSEFILLLNNDAALLHHETGAVHGAPPPGSCGSGARPVPF
jgi:GT2 family glycosyltransferase